MWEGQVVNNDLTTINIELPRAASHARTVSSGLAVAMAGRTLVSDSRKQQSMTKKQEDRAVEKSGTERAPCTIAEEIQYFPIIQALADQTSALSPTTARLGGARSGLGGEQKRKVWCAEASGLHRGEVDPRSVKRFVHSGPWLRFLF